MPHSTVEHTPLERAREALRDADHVLIGGGAGLSTAAGLSYDGPRFERTFGAFIDRYGITDMYSAGFYPYETLGDFWAFWSLHIRENRFAPGPTALYRDIVGWASQRDMFVLTTNVDGQFTLAGAPDDRLFAPQGDLALIQCSRGCHPRTYDDRAMVEAMVADTGHGARTSLRDRSLIPHCPACGAPMSVNVRCDSTFVENDAWHAARRRCREWVDDLYARDGDGGTDGIGERGGTPGHGTVLLELGVGWNTPIWIRYPFERIAQQTGATLIRINADPMTMRPSTPLPADAYIPLQGDIAALWPLLTK